MQGQDGVLPEAIRQYRLGNRRLHVDLQHQDIHNYFIFNKIICPCGKDPRNKNHYEILVLSISSET